MTNEQLAAQVQSLKAQLDSLYTRVAGINTGANVRAAESYERQIRERVFSMRTATYSVEYALEATEKAVRYIVDGKV